MRTLSSIVLATAFLGCQPSEQVIGSGEPAPVAPAVDDTDVPAPEPILPESDDLSYLPADYAAEDPVLFVFAGDSISKGYGASDPDTLGYDSLLWSNEDALYPEWTDNDLVTDYPSIERAVDIAFGGATTQSVLDVGIPALDEWLLGAFPDGVQGETVVFLTIGGNDLQEALLPSVDSAETAAATLARLETVVDALTDPVRFPGGVKLYMTNVYEPSGGVGQSSCFFGWSYPDVLPDLNAYNASVQQMGMDRGFAVVDLYTAFLPHGANAADPSLPTYDEADPTNWFANDCIHPNDRGHHELRRMMWHAVHGGTGVGPL